MRVVPRSVPGTLPEPFPGRAGRSELAAFQGGRRSVARCWPCSCTRPACPRCRSTGRSRTRYQQSAIDSRLAGTTPTRPSRLRSCLRSCLRSPPPWKRIPAPTSERRRSCTARAGDVGHHRRRHIGDQRLESDASRRTAATCPGRGGWSRTSRTRRPRPVSSRTAGAEGCICPSCRAHRKPPGRWGTAGRRTDRHRPIAAADALVACRGAPRRLQSSVKQSVGHHRHAGARSAVHIQATEIRRSPGTPSFIVTTWRRFTPRGTSCSFLHAVTQPLHSMQRSASQGISCVHLLLSSSSGLARGTGWSWFPASWSPSRSRRWWRC